MSPLGPLFLRLPKLPLDPPWWDGRVRVHVVGPSGAVDVEAELLGDDASSGSSPTP